MNAGIDLQGTFIESLVDFGITSELAKVLWMPFPMVLMLIGAVFGVFVGALPLHRLGLLSIGIAVVR